MTTKKSKRSKSSKKNLSEEQKLQQNQKREIRSLMKNLGFYRVKDVERRQFTYNDVTSEFDDIFVYENLLFISEYTVARNRPGEHLKQKSFIYKEILNDVPRFVSEILERRLFLDLNFYYDSQKTEYSPYQIQVAILYASYNDIDDADKKKVPGICYFDRPAIQYFSIISNAIKKSALNEFCLFAGVDVSKIGDKIKRVYSAVDETFTGVLLPTEYSKYQKGYKIVSFYMDADSLLKRAYVLRRDGWRDENASLMYQRLVVKRKITSMRSFLAKQQRVFINNIIATISKDDVELIDQESQSTIKILDSGLCERECDYSNKITPVHLQIKLKANCIGIIDGQHRVFAYHEGDDVYEEKISKIRKEQTLLVTAIIFPKNETQDERLKFEASQFLEINKNQTHIQPALEQAIETILDSLSPTAICVDVLRSLNVSGPLKEKFMIRLFEKRGIKTASIISYGLKPLVKIDDSDNSDSLFKVWSDVAQKQILQNQSNYDITELENAKKAYVNFCTTHIRDIVIAFRNVLPQDTWHFYDPKTSTGQLTIRFVNGMMALLRCIIRNKNKLYTEQEYEHKLHGFDATIFSKYGGSQYNKLGEALYESYFKESKLK